MANEAAKTLPRFAPYLTGLGIDIGGGSTPIIPEAQVWDIAQGDAQWMQGLPPESFNWVSSFHCLEHLRDPAAALARWWALVKPQGYLLLAVPDVTAYESGIWPSQLNPDHKCAFTTSQDYDGHPACYNLTDLIRPLPNHRLERLERIIIPHGLEDLDPTAGDGVAQIELVLQKISPVPVQSALRQLFACPQCFKEVVAVGVDKEGKLIARCTRCGTGGSYEL